MLTLDDEVSTLSFRILPVAHMLLCVFRLNLSGYVAQILVGLGGMREVDFLFSETSEMECGTIFISRGESLLACPHCQALIIRRDQCRYVGDGYQM